MIQLAQFLFQKRTGGSLGRGVFRRNRNRTHPQRDAQTNKDRRPHAMVHPQKAQGAGTHRAELGVSTAWTVQPGHLATRLSDREFGATIPAIPAFLLKMIKPAEFHVSARIAEHKLYQMGGLHESLPRRAGGGRINRQYDRIVTYLWTLPSRSKTKTALNKRPTGGDCPAVDG